MQQVSIEDIGVGAALFTLLPAVRAAGELARSLQPHISRVAPPQQKESAHIGLGNLTHADILVEDQIGAEIFQQFSDASFWGEEHKHDHISQFIPNDRPYLITLDPINGTLQYGHGLPHYETIVSICDREWNVLGVIVYRPAFEEAFVGWKHATISTKRHIDHVRWSEDGSVRRMPLPHLKAQSTKLHLDDAWMQHAERFNAERYELLDIWSDYKGQKDWPYSQLDVVLGNCRGMAWLHPYSFFIDAGAIGFLTECAGGVWRRGALDPATMLYHYTIATADPKTADLLEHMTLERYPKSRNALLKAKDG